MTNLAKLWKSDLSLYEANWLSVQSPKLSQKSYTLRDMEHLKVTGYMNASNSKEYRPFSFLVWDVTE